MASNRDDAPLASPDPTVKLPEKLADLRHFGQFWGITSSLLYKKGFLRPTMQPDIRRTV
jgi:hypothetical protein